MDADLKILRDAVEAGPTGYRPGDSTWMAVNGRTVMLDSPRPVWARIATCDRDETSAYIAAANPARISRILDAMDALRARLEAAEADARRYRWLRLDERADVRIVGIGRRMGHDLDAAIDAALAETAEKGER